MVNRVSKKIESYKELRIWQDGIALTKLIYTSTTSFPADERYGLSSQMKRAAISIPSNIAEGNRRQHSKEFIQFLRIALGSVGELETQALIAHDLGWLNAETFDTINEYCDKIGRGIINLQRAIEKTIHH